MEKSYIEHSKADFKHSYSHVSSSRKHIPSRRHKGYQTELLLYQHYNTMLRNSRE